jgi:hypothetical protein
MVKITETTWHASCDIFGYGACEKYGELNSDMILDYRSFGATAEMLRFGHDLVGSPRIIQRKELRKMAMPRDQN